MCLCRSRRKKHKMYLLIHNVVFDVVKVCLIQVHIVKFSARAVTLEEVLKSPGKRLSEIVFDKDEIMSILVQILQHKD